MLNQFSQKNSFSLMQGTSHFLHKIKFFHLIWVFIFFLSGPAFSNFSSTQTNIPDTTNINDTLSASAPPKSLSPRPQSNLQLQAGIRLQKTHNYHYHNGLFINLGHGKIFSGSPQLGIMYISSRLGSALNSFAFEEDYYLGNLKWVFRKSKFIQPFLQIDAGYFWLNDEGLNLPNTSGILNFFTGLNFQYHQGMPGLGIDLGWQQIRKTDAQFPLVFGINLNLPLSPLLNKSHFPKH